MGAAVERPPGKRIRPAGNRADLEVVGDDTASIPQIHGADLAADAAPWWNTLAWEQAIVRDAAAGRAFSADELQARYGLPDIGSACGGVFMRAHRAGVIRRIGYRPSGKRSRSGGVVAVWTGVPR